MGNLSIKLKGVAYKHKWSINCNLYLSRHRRRRRDGTQLSAGGSSGSSLIQTRAPLIPEWDYQGSLPPQPGSTIDQGQHGSSSGN